MNFLASCEQRTNQTNANAESHAPGEEGKKRGVEGQTEDDGSTQQTISLSFAHTQTENDY